ncbi:hypothetical protein M413DRAFT_132356 [Hebeloma cylindrosporum]|uniref:DUF6534 domain-containing protein n=1 Tax=Hebeloma cylindrosporum TaxID=76867 RepID=A0A0C3C0F1_HEBCY|nr:hypothetical protein M413DRAFT_132356 [Hebeloma cylindrosporum h7]
MQYVLACGFLTSACSLGAVISYATMPKALVFIGMHFLLPRMYMFSYMFMLNARRVTAEIESSSFNVTGAFNQFRLGQNSTWVDQTERKPSVTMETEIINDQVSDGGTKLYRNFTCLQFLNHFYDEIPLTTSKYYPGRKKPQQASLEHYNSNIGITVHRTENRLYDTQA